MEKESTTEVKVKNEKKEIAIINEETIKNKIYVIRDHQVMLDFDLAELYGYTTKAFNQQVKNNMDKFPPDFMFQISKTDIEIMARSKKLTARNWTVGNTGGRTSLPYAFTEQGIYMLMTVLKGELAIKQSIALIRLFKAMKEYIANSNRLLMNTNEYLESRFSKQDEKIEDINNKLEVVMKCFDDPITYKEYLIYKNKRIESDIAYQSIYSLAKQSIVVIDDYIDVKTFELLKVCKPNVKIKIFSDIKNKNNLTDTYLEDFKQDTGLEISINPSHGLSHDRFIAIDLEDDDSFIFISGASSKDCGNRASVILEVSDKKRFKDFINKLIIDMCS